MTSPLLPTARKAWLRLNEKTRSALYPRLVGFACGPGTRIMPGAVVEPAGGYVSIGSNCLLHEGSRILAYGGSVIVGDRTSVNPFSILYGHGGLSIGTGVLIAAHVVMIPSNHNTELGKPIRGQGSTSKGIVIEDDVWIGAGAHILDDVHIESGAVIAAGAVITAQRVEANTILGGIPARPIGRRK